jgi:hypothetical protein
LASGAASYSGTKQVYATSVKLTPTNAIEYTSLALFSIRQHIMFLHMSGLVIIIRLQLGKAVSGDGKSVLTMFQEGLLVTTICNGSAGSQIDMVNGYRTLLYRYVGWDGY